MQNVRTNVSDDQSFRQVFHAPFILQNQEASLLPAGNHGAASRPSTPEERVALRLQKRLRRSTLSSPPIPALIDAIREQHDLMKRSVHVSFVEDNGTALGEWYVSLQQYPHWIAPEFSLTDAHFSLRSERIQEHITRFPPPQVQEPVHATILGTEQKGTIERATTDTVARNGRVLDNEASAVQLRDALHNQLGQITLTLRTAQGHITMRDEESTLELQLLATGKSNYRGSPDARIWNVQKAINDHVNNVLIPARAVYSFNSTLSGAISLANGWRMAKVIVSGDQLEMRPGGGICQASTTVYRSIVNGGFPVLERRAHSLYVTYYKEFGVGIDATVYPGTQDLTFLNDTPSPLLMQAYTEKETGDVIVAIYGIPDGRKVSLSGPYFRSTASKELTDAHGAIAGNEIAWLQTVVNADGTKRDYAIVSRYINFPASLVREFQTPVEGREIIAHLGN
ncbi:MAG: VanW family protein [Candidatus Peregrinibacteria bacterium]